MRIPSLCGGSHGRRPWREPNGARRDERRTLFRLVEARCPSAEIAVRLGRYRSTVHRELGHDRFRDGFPGCFPLIAQEPTGRRWRRRRRKPAADGVQDAAGRGPDYWPAHLFPGSAYGHFGRPEEAGAALAAARRRTRLASLRDTGPADDCKAGPERDRLLEGLALAGLPRE